MRQVYKLIHKTIFYIHLFFINPKILLNKKKSNLLIILGIGRSGTTWISKIISQTEEPIRSIQEPIYDLGIKLHPHNDQTSIPYSDKKSAKLIEKIYQACTLSKNTLKKMYPKEHIYKNKIFKNDKGFKNTLIKEVHCLLATENIIKSINKPMVLITRNIERTIDSQLVFSGYYRPVLINEFEFIQEDSFLNRFFPKEKNKILNEIKRIKKIKTKKDSFIAKKSIVSILINEMFKKLGAEYPNVLTISYEKTCDHSLKEYRKIAKHFNLTFGNKAKKALEDSQKKSSDSSHHNSIYRDTKNQKTKPFKFLTKKDFILINKIKDHVGLTGE